MERNHNNKNKDPRVPEDIAKHPRHEPYKREHRDWMNYLLDDDDLIEEENAPV